jgi:membrane-associated phospholipid phosphatase
MTLRSTLAALRSASPLPRPRAAGRRAGFRPRLEPLEDRCLLSADVVLEWNQLLLNAVKANGGAPFTFSRNAAIVSAAVYDAVNAIDRSYTPLFADVKAPRGASLEAAAAQAAHDTLAELFPTQQDTFDAALAADLAGIPPGLPRLGVAVGHEAARQILAWRSTDGSNDPSTYVPGTGPGVWQPTPRPNPNPPPAELPGLPAAAPQWATATPFCIPANSAFRPPPQPGLNSVEYTDAFNEVKSLGARDSTTRTAEQTEIARFWAGAAGTFTSGGYWNQIAQDVAARRGNSLVENARLFGLLNVAQADAYFAVWDAKYTYNFWRPVTAIRAADTDGNPDTSPDPGWAPLLVTPNHPSYVSGHSGHSAAAAAVLAAFFGTDAVGFSLTSDSVPGGVTRSFDSFSAAVREVSDARVYAGIHWRFDVAAGEALGYEVGNYVVSHCLLARDNPSRWGPGHPAGDAAPTGAAILDARPGVFNGHEGAVANAPVVVGAFGTVGGDETSVLTVASVLVNDQARGRAGWVGALDGGLKAPATVVHTTTRDARPSGAGAVTGRGAGGLIDVAPGGVARADLLTVIASDLASTEDDDVFGDLFRR